jgi:hypothetical protein
LGLTVEEAHIRDAHRDFQDHKTFCRESLGIRDKRGVTVPFELYPAPAGLHKIIQDRRAKGKPVRVIVLKARQVLISAGTAAEFFHDCAFLPGQKALIVSHEANSTEQIFSYYQQLQANYQPFRGLIDTLPVVRDTDNVLEWEGGGYIKVATANNLKTGRSFSLRYLHLSEFAFWRDAKTLMTGLMQAVPDDPDTAVIIESTANGVGGEFYRLWQLANDPTQDTEWIPYFFAWWEHPEYVREPDDPAAFQRSLTREEIQLRDRYHLTLAQLNWRRWAIKNKCGGSPETFKQEYPSCPEEAFLFSGRPRFDHASLARMPVDATGGAVGELQEIQQGPKTVLRFFPDSERRGAMVVYDLPKANHTYVMGVDVAEGKDASDILGSEDPDYSVACILDRQTGAQVAKIRCRMFPAAFAEYCQAAARFYNWAFMAPEANGPGIAFIEQLLRDDWPPALILHRERQADEQFALGDNAILSKLGFRTSAVSRVQLLSRHDQNIREFGVFIRDPITLAEHQSFVIKANGKAEAADGCHDDEVFACALAGVAIEAAPADRSLAGIKKPGPPGVSVSGTVKSYGQRRLPERGVTIRF